jgi:branched-chain amino acid transport system substrate-binding protein
MKQARLLWVLLWAAVHAAVPVQEMQLAHEPQSGPEKTVIDLPIPTKAVGGNVEVVVNASLPLTGEMSVLGKQVLDGMTLFFNKLKQRKTKGLIIRLNVQDDGFETIKTRDNITAMAQQSPLCISLLSTRSLLAVSDLIKDQKILALFPMEGSASMRSAGLDNVVFFRPSYEQEIGQLVAYAVNTLHKSKIGLFYEASDSGDDALMATKKVLTQYKLPLHAEAWYPAQTLQVERAANELALKAPNIIICVSKARPTYNFVRYFVNKGLHKTVFMGLSGLDSIQDTLKKSRGIQLITSSVVPDQALSEVQIVKEFRADLARFMSNKKPTAYALEGYINAALFYEVLKITPQPLTVRGVLKTIASLKRVEFKGLQLQFDAATRTLSQQVYTLGPVKEKSATEKQKTKDPS